VVLVIEKYKSYYVVWVFGKNRGGWSGKIFDVISEDQIPALLAAVNHINSRIR